MVTPCLILVSHTVTVTKSPRCAKQSVFLLTTCLMCHLLLVFTVCTVLHRDCIELVRSRLIEAGWSTAAELKAIEKDLRAFVDDETAKARSGYASFHCYDCDCVCCRIIGCARVCCVWTVDSRMKMSCTRTSTGRRSRSSFVALILNHPRSQREGGEC